MLRFACCLVWYSCLHFDFTVCLLGPRGTLEPVPFCHIKPCTERLSNHCLNICTDVWKLGSCEPVRQHQMYRHWEAADLGDSTSHDASCSQIPGPQMRRQAELRRQGHAEEGGAGESHDNGGCNSSHPPAQVLEDEAPRQHQPNGHAACCYGDICQDPLQT